MPFQLYTAEIKLLYVNRILAGDSLAHINEITGRSPAPDTVAIWVALFQATQSVVANPEWYNMRGAPHILTPDLRNFLSEAIDADPTLYLHELAAHILEVQGVRIGIQTLQVEIRDRLGLTLKVALTVDPNQDELEHARFLYEVGTIPVECLIAYGEFFWCTLCGFVV